jgi:hypothetical protein
MCVGEEQGLSLCTTISLCQKLPGDIEKLVAFQKHVIGLHKISNYILSQTGNANKSTVYFNMPFVDVMAKPMVMKT